MKDYIEREAAIDAIYKRCAGEHWEDILRSLEPADVRPVVRGDGMSDLISKQAAIDEVHGAIYEFFNICDDNEESPMTYEDKKLLEINKAITVRIKQLPPSQLKREKGKWIKIGQSFVFPENFRGYSCSECGYDTDKIKFNFCPNCGADMRKE